MSRSSAAAAAVPFTPLPDWECISQGAEARLYKIPNYLPITNNNSNNNNNRACIAKERFSKAYRHALLDERLTKQRCRAEAKCLVKCRRAGVSCPAVWGVRPPVLYLEFVEGPTVRQYLQQHLQLQQQQQHHLQQQQKHSNHDDDDDDDAQQRRQVDDDDDDFYSNLAVQMGLLIAKTHNVGVAHADLTTSNMLVRNGTTSTSNTTTTTNTTTTNKITLVLLDFGLARMSTNPEEFAVDLYVLERALISTHPELEEKDFLQQVLSAYKANMHKSDTVLHRLSQVRARGRKRECFG